MNPVLLDPAELAAAVRFARLRREHHRGAGADVPWAELMGTIGEIAVAKAFGVLAQWTAEAAYRIDFAAIPADVGRNVQVRAIDSDRCGLAVRPSDPSDAPYILALVDRTPPHPVTLLGWEWGSEVKRRGPLQSHWPRPAHRVGIRTLKPMETFPDGHVTSDDSAPGHRG